MLLTYAAFTIAIFKIFKIPLNKWTVPTAVLGGVVLVGSMVLIMNYNYPHSKVAFRGYVSIPINPVVSGLIVEVPVKPNTPVKKGDVLFKIDPTAYQLELNKKKAALNVAKSQVAQLKAAIQEAQSTVDKAKSERDRTQMAYERAKKAESAMAATVLESKRQFAVSAQAAYEKTKASLERAKFELSTLENEKLAQLEADVKKAEWNLSMTVVKAPSDGYVTHLRARPGLMAVPFPVRSAISFVPNGSRYVVAAFRQNAMQNLKEGYDAELIFQGLPGKVFKGKIEKVLPALGEGELQGAGSMIKTAEIMGAKQGLATVLIKVEDDTSSYVLPDGALAEVAIYTGKAHHVAIIRKMLLRMKSWQNFLYLDH